MSANLEHSRMIAACPHSVMPALDRASQPECNAQKLSLVHFDLIPVFHECRALAQALFDSSTRIVPALKSTSFGFKANSSLQRIFEQDAKIKSVEYCSFRRASKPSLRTCVAIFLVCSRENDTF
jgi:hypothetical protein